MKKILLCFSLIVTLKAFSQCSVSFTMNLTPQSCSVCCDGSIQITNANGCAPFTATLAPTCCGSFSGLIASNLCPGTYSVTVLDAGCCSPTTQTCNIGWGTNIFEHNNPLSIILYPNPVSNKLFISSEKYFGAGTKIEIETYLGQTVLKVPFAKEVDVSQLPQGCYFLKLKSNNQQFNSKFIKE